MKPDNQCVWVNDDLSHRHSQGAGDDAQGAAGAGTTLIALTTLIKAIMVQFNNCDH